MTDIAGDASWRATATALDAARTTDANAALEATADDRMNTNTPLESNPDAIVAPAAPARAGDSVTPSEEGIQPHRADLCFL